jgi:SAM-dependent methyltransferase
MVEPARRAPASVVGLCRIYERLGLLHNAERYAYYLATVFETVPFEGARVLDVGSGNGLIACLAVMRGARSVVGLEPESCGSTQSIRSAARDAIAMLGLESRVTIATSRLQDFIAEPHSFDVIVLHNSINHLDERACRTLDSVSESGDAYAALAQRLAALTAEGGHLFVSDCSPRNRFSFLGRFHPLARNIDWRLHQPPERWVELLEEDGFEQPDIRWTPLLRLGPLGRPLTGNRLAASLTTSHFYFTMRRSR